MVTDIEKKQENWPTFLDHPMSGLEKAVWWTEYVLRHGHTNLLRNPSSDIPWYQFLLLDVTLFFLFTTVAVVYLFIKALQLSKWLIYKLYNTLVKRTIRKTN